jgi:hypothetical protein
MRLRKMIAQIGSRDLSTTIGKVMELNVFKTVFKNYVKLIQIINQMILDIKQTK